MLPTYSYGLARGQISGVWYGDWGGEDELGTVQANESLDLAGSSLGSQAFDLLGGSPWQVSQ
ncbi:MAG TPA: hypothetical protein VE569_04080, partial [Acidimicrobiia bacterium]|nr:hypothetical protein [Acidimicrobiia bacterium]